MPYEEHPCCESIPDDSKIWRYMDFTKFVSLLERKQLYFSLPVYFDDPFECSNTARSRLINEIRLGFFLQEDKEELREIEEKVFNSIRENIAINCWHINSVESAAMWKLYLKSSEGIAIQSTFGRLKDGLAPSVAKVSIGKVQYIDYQEDTIPNGNLFYRALSKRKSFEHENELRALFMPSSLGEPFDKGVYIDIDINTLIETIYIEPTAPHWITELVQSVLSRYQLDVDVRSSSLRESPIM